MEATAGAPDQGYKGHGPRPSNNEGLVYEKVSALLGSPFGLHRRSYGRGPSAARSPGLRARPGLHLDRLLCRRERRLRLEQRRRQHLPRLLRHRRALRRRCARRGRARHGGSVLRDPGDRVRRQGGNNDGFVGGAQVGFNYQFTPGSGFVVGVEADIQWMGGNDGNKGFFGFGNGGLFAANPVAPFLTPGFGIVGVPATGANVALFNNGGSGRSNSNDWFATARVRVGYAFDRVLVYATGGIAFTDDSGNNRGFGGFNSGPSFRRRSTSAPGRP